jgi:serine/threonine protein kinase
VGLHQAGTTIPSLLQVGSALNHMHEKRIMHRDLKPANIFISSDGSLKVGDLGLGRVFSSETIEAYSKVGTPLYMSPEVTCSLKIFSSAFTRGGIRHEI